MFDVSAILTRVLTKGSVPAGISNSADRVFGFFSIRMAMACVRGSLLSTAIGTTAPFSAMSGPVISMALLGVEPLPPSALTVSATFFVSNAALFHSCASASPGRMIPAAAASASTPPPVFNTSRRLASTSLPRISRHRETEILQWLPSECDARRPLFSPRVLCVRVTYLRRELSLGTGRTAMLLQGSAALVIRSGLHAAYACLVVYSGLLVFGLMCLIWSGTAGLLAHVLSPGRGRVLGRWVTSYGFRCYLQLLALSGVFRFDLRALDSLRGAGPLIIAPNHPGLLDAVMVLSRLPNVACVMKAELINNPIYGAAARLAGYIRNDDFIGAAAQAVENLKAGSQLLLFPEGTRTTRRPVNPLKGGAPLVSKRSGVPVQTVLIETTSPFLSKGWPLHRIPPLPICCRVRLGRRFMPKDNLRETIAEMEAYLASELDSRIVMDSVGEPLAQPQKPRLDER